MYNNIIDKLKNKNICILGFGMEGISSYNFIRRHLPKQPLTIIDKKDISTLDIIKDDKNITTISGDDYLNNLDKYDVIIKTPGISFKDIDVSSFIDNVTSQLELVLEVFKDKCIGITGTKGKSTTTSLLYKVLKDQGYDTYLLGNIGIPILDEVEKYNENTYLVIEMSAHQLEYIHFSPHIGVILNLFEDHLDHAGSVARYHQNKMNMFKYQDSNDIGVYSKDNENLVKQITSNKYLSNLYSVTLFEDISNKTIHLKNNDVIYNNNILYNINEKRNLIGNHNVSNIMFILLIGKLLNLDNNLIRKTISTFEPLEHRLELVGTYNNITYYNDSIATIPNATINAIESLKEVDTLIFGGMDRGINYNDLIEYLKTSNVKNLICMPTTGYKIGKILEPYNLNKNIYYEELLEDAVKKAKDVTEKNKICLLSPAASSYEYFKNFMEKGNKYKELVRKEK